MSGVHGCDMQVAWRVLRLPVLVLVASLGGSSADAQTLTTLATFSGGSGGGGPYAPVYLDASGNIYGTTYYGGAHNYGTVFEVPAGTQAVTTLASFDGTNGFQCHAGLIADASGNLYGTASSGGANSYGTLFQLAAGSHAFSPVLSFSRSGGGGPSSGLIADANGNFYGVTSFGGAYSYGAIYKVAAGTHALSTLASFNGTNGSSAAGALIADANGNLYGTTQTGGAYGCGTVFEYVAQTRTITTLASFDVSNGNSPGNGLAADANGNLFGTTYNGGANGKGTLFEVAAGTRTLTTLVTFNGGNGSNPVAPLIIDAAGNLYGTAGGGPNGWGTVFRVDAGTHSLTTLVAFNQANGASPYAGLVADTAGNLYGTTNQGGIGADGTVFKLSGTGFVVVPEPTSLGTVTLAGVALLLRRRRRGR